MSNNNNNILFDNISNLTTGCDTCHDIDEWKCTLNINSDLLTVIHVNLNSIRAKWDLLCIKLEPVLDQLDVLILTEVDVHEEQAEVFQLRNFKQISKCRLKRAGGGIIIFYRDSIEIENISYNFEEAENLIIKLTHSEYKFECTLLAIYRPPDCKLDKFLNDINFWLQNAAKKDELIYMIGDINVCIRRKSNFNSRYLNTLYNNTIVPLINLPTREEVLAGTACIRHVVLSAAPQFTSVQWGLITACMDLALRSTAMPCVQLMSGFRSGSTQFYGDLAHVKVAARRDSNPEEIVRLRHLTHQVFLLDSQKTEDHLASTQDNEYQDNEQRSYILLMFPIGLPDTADPEQYVIRVPYRNVLVGLLTHQILLQTLGVLLVHGSPHVNSSVCSALVQTHSPPSSPSPLLLPGLLPHIPPAYISRLLRCLDFSYATARLFDSRPGLKFLVQKVAGLDRAANLFRQTGAAWLFKFVALFHLSAREIERRGLSCEQVLRVLDQRGIEGENEETISSGELASYLQDLKSLFTDLCDTYISIVTTSNIQTHNQESAVPFSFNFAQFDEFEELLVNNKERSFIFPNVKFTKTAAAQPTHLCDENVQVSDLKKLDKLSESGNPQDDVSEVNNTNDENKEILESNDEIIRSVEALSDNVSKVTEKSDTKSEDEGIDNAKSNLQKSKDKPDNILEPTAAGSEPSNSIDSDEKSSPQLLDFAEDDESAPCCAVTETLLEEYKRKKSLYSFSMPPTSLRSPLSGVENSTINLPEEIEEQRRNSLVKDSESHLAVWADMLVSVFEVLSRLDNAQWKLFLPLIFPGVRKLTAHATHPTLKQSLADFFQRVAEMYGFSP